MPPYTWTCLACTAANPPESTTCSRCGCPAQATGDRIASARRAWQQREGITPPAPFDLAAELKTMPLLLIAAALFAALGVGALVVSVAANFPSLTAFGALLLAFAALSLSSYRAPAR